MDIILLAAGVSLLSVIVLQVRAASPKLVKIPVKKDRR
jgi:hypothetical protein